ncbi:dTDP-4-dehydrorhamnose reductase [Sinirhodobacter ferrireducens]|uniref:dTDP-4-dehydrorhamnose reductase n=1 Tax=Paenirhodobacter ferrireducens TaxID=1215032 RepID=A0A443LKV6_9RHOB|nr:dTDP-4-dehydrorhamnose reductase [Sinirhodobacter ferrireducens]RWR49826.1 dTDP-4-dehydrorhamnose reductase [Sinirhodobacter ferrireducens]
MILVFGKTGQVATELQALASGARFLGRDEADLSNPEACAAQIRVLGPAAVINAAAWTAVDKAEAEEAAATVVNGAAPAAMAAVCAELGIPFVQISTDYVFDGAGEAPFAPDAPTAPLGAYGRSKLVGEEGVRAAGGVHAILRTSWVFSAHGANFLKTMRRLGAERERLTVVADQIGGPTPARAIAEACLTIAQALIVDPAKTGTYHFSGAPDVSWAAFAREIMAQAGLSCAIEEIPTSAYPTPARRPANSRMACETLSAFGLSRPDWRAATREALTELGTIA